MKFKYALTILVVFFYSNIVNAQNTLNNIGLTSSTPASVAYSLRLLSSSYAGPLVRIKVGTSFYDVYPDLSTNKFSLNSKISASISTYNAASAAASTYALSTIISGSTDATVAIWYDQSGNGVHVLSSNAAAQIISLGTINTINGQPTIFFNSTGYLVSSSTVDYSAQVGATVNAVVQNVATTSNVGGIIGTAYIATQPGYGIAVDATFSNGGFYSDGAGGGWYTGVLTTSPKILTDIFLNNSNTSSNFYVNGVLKSTSASAVGPIYPLSGSRIYIGRARGYSGFDFNGYISEALIFPNKINTSEQLALETSQSIFVPQPPSVTITSSASGTICAGTSVTFTANVYNFTTTPTYQWYKNNTLITGATSSTYSTTTLSNNDVISASAIPASVSASTVTSNLIANLDAGNSSSYNGSGNTWTDLTGNGNNVALSNTGYSSVNGGGIALNTNGYGTQTLSNSPFNGDFTWSTIFKYNDGNWDWIYNIGGYNGLILTAIGKPALSWGGWFNNKINAAAESSLTNGNYYMLTFVRSGNVISCYLQSSPYGIGSSVSGNISLVSPLIGKGPGGEAWANGIVNLILLYNRALTPSEITQNYNTYASRFGFSAAGISSNTITTTISASPSANIIVNGDACINKTTLTTTSALSSYTWYKDNVAISGATSNTYTPSASGDYQVQVSNGTCSNTSTSTTIYTCGRTADGRMSPISSSTTLVTITGEINSKYGVDERGLLLTKPFANTPTSANPVTSGLILYLDATRSASFGGTGNTWADISGLTPAGSATLVGSPVFGSGSTSNGSGSFTFGSNINASTTKTYTIDNEITYIAWVNPSTNFDGGVIVRRTDPSFNSGATSLYLYNNNLGYDWDNQNWGWRSNLTVPNNQWSMIVITVNSSSVTAYLCNASGIASVSSGRGHSSLTSKGATNFFIAYDPYNPSTRAFVGKMGTAMVYSVALSSADISSIYNAQKAAFGL